MAERPPDAARRALLHGSARIEPALRPPWAGNESEFLETCQGSGDCIRACPERIVIRADGGYPAVDFQRGACTFCGACVEACASGALSKHRARAWERLAQIEASCLVRRGVHCQACRDACPESAIRFAPARAVPRPALDPARCTACGACVGACPVAAIAIRPVREAA